MLTVTNEQIYDRWEHVPETLKEAFFSSDNGDHILKACEEVGISEEAAEQVLMVVGNIMLGFTQINDLANELRSISGMDPQAIDRIVFQLDKRVFAPLKADILKLYGDMAGTGPRMVAEEASAISRKAIESAPTMMVTETTISAPGKGAAEVEIRKIRIGDTPQGTGPEAPTMIHSEAELQPVAQKRRALSSFGGMFGFGQAQKKAGPAVTAEVSMVEGVGVHPQGMAQTEQRPVRVVHYTSAKGPEDIFGMPAQEQKEAPAFVPVTKQEHEIDFEPKIIDLTHGEPPAAVAQERDMRSAPPVGAPVVPPVAAPEAPIPPMAGATQAMVMKTPQRTETVALPPKDREPRLAEIPVSGDVIDLRALEGVVDNRQADIK